MARRVIDRLRERIRSGQYVVPFHAASELDDDDLSVLDFENVILTGKIIERQRDPQTHERKYVVQGHALEGQAVCCVIKFGPTAQAILITIWAE